MQRRDFLGLALASGAGLLLAGCGFHLRGVGGEVLALDSLALEGADTDFAKQLASRLENLGTRIDADAPLRLNLGGEDIITRQVGVLDTGSQDQELVLRVPYSIQRASDGAYVADRQAVEVIQEFSITDDNLLSQDELRNDALEDARREAVRQMIDRLRAIEEI
ncbi:twin-arginine translocation signal domain-containing protein [Halomonas denitrificans]|uniref:LPS-assembly lipoprotein LptE n=1 Tax=Halomonas TaxID=2745 RepID=UPI001A8E1D68|nr:MULTISPECIES: LPS assembly lipoprotein LptE [Halomonas]MBN8413448.1 twin-arginine translocation signal domain-containing protein [Halomonas litopenaei]MCA0973248.1 twin-arginine translocation signal domain-containing protein [Halomonas denitrificans]